MEGVEVQWYSRQATHAMYCSGRSRRRKGVAVRSARQEGEEGRAAVQGR